MRDKKHADHLDPPPALSGRPSQISTYRIRAGL
jgi:hypothetical protein